MKINQRRLTLEKCNKRELCEWGEKFQSSSRGLEEGWVGGGATTQELG